MIRAVLQAETDITTAGPARAALRPLVQLLLAGGAALALAGCVAGSDSSEAAAPGEVAAPKTQRSTRIVERDVEAPQVFQVSDQALWDGRPSLGGVWVASPDVTDPERVIMRNPANGKFVIGALFKRERDNPGPKLQISSDAADALGLLAGQPAKLSVTALRREQAESKAPAAPVLDSNESLAAAKAAAPGSYDAGGVSAAPLAAPAGAAPVAAGASAAILAAEASPPAANKPAASKPAAARPEPAKAAATKPAAAAPAAAGSGRPIQIGFFSVETNATRAVDALAKAGVQATKRKESASGKDYWTVVTRGDAALLKKIKAAGFADAYLLK